MSGGLPRHEVSRTGRALRYLPGLTLAAVVTVTSTSEWTLARTVLDLPPAVAWAVPVAIDSYVVAAMRTRRDVPAAIGVMAGALAAAMGAHLAAAARPHGQPLPVEVTAPAAAAIMSVLVIVAWRVHVLIDHFAEDHARTRPAATLPAAVTGTATPGTSTPAALPAPAAEYVPAAPPEPSSTSTPTAVPGAGGVAAAPHRTPTTRTPQTTPAEPGRPGLTDEQIMTTIRETGDGTSPGIRALKRTYAIGQARAARIHTQTTDQKAHQESTEDHSSDPQNDESASNHEIQNQDPSRKTEQQPPSDIKITNQESHPGITDRVGRSRSTEELPDEHFPALFQPAGER